MTLIASSSVAMVVGWLAEHAPRAVAAADAQVHASAGQLVERGEGGSGHRRLAGRRVRDAGAEPQALGGRAISVSST